MLQNLSFATASNEIANGFLLDALIFYIIAINIYGFAFLREGRKTVKISNSCY